MHTTRCATLFTLPTLLLGCTFNLGVVSAERTVSSSDTGWTRFRVTESTPFERVTVRGSAGTTVDARVAITGAFPAGREQDAIARISASLTRSGTDLVLEVQCPDPYAENPWFGDATVQVPANAQTDIAASNAGITVTGMNAHVHAATSNAQIEVETAGGVDLHTSNGAIHLHAAGGAAHTSNADIEATWDSATRLPLDLDTSNAPITVHVGTSGGFDLNVDTSNASVTVRTRGIETRGESYVGRIRGGGPLLRVHSSNASITIVD